MEITLFRVLRDPERTRIEIDDPLMGVGAVMPCGRCYVDWNRDAYPPEERLDHHHISDYGSLEDVRQGTGGAVEVVDTIPLGP